VIRPLTGDARKSRRAANESFQALVSNENVFVHSRFRSRATTLGLSSGAPFAGPFTWLHNSLCGAGRLRCRGIADVAKQRQ